jgi:glutamate synthase (NADH)
VIGHYRHMRPGVNVVGGSILQDFGLDEHLDRHLLEQASPVLEGKCPSVDIRTVITNSNRAVGSTLTYYIAKKHGDNGLPAGSINIRMTSFIDQNL